MSALWPVFDLRVVTPRLELRGVTDELAHELAVLAADGVHDPATTPFVVGWTDLAPPDLERGVLQFHWRNRAELSPAAWTVSLAAIVDGVVVGTIDLSARDFAVLGQFETGSWLGRRHHSQGLGTEMRLAALHLGFDGFGAEWATTGAFVDNEASLAVTRKLGYTEAGRRRTVSRGTSRTLVGYELHRDAFARHLRRDDVTLHGADAVRSLLTVG